MYMYTCTQTHTNTHTHTHKHAQYAHSHTHTHTSTHIHTHTYTQTYTLTHTHTHTNTLTHIYTHTHIYRADPVTPVLSCSSPPADHSASATSASRDSSRPRPLTRAHSSARPTTSLQNCATENRTMPRRMSGPWAWYIYIHVYIYICIYACSEVPFRQQSVPLAPFDHVHERPRVVQTPRRSRGG